MIQVTREGKNKTIARVAHANAFSCDTAEKIAELHLICVVKWFHETKPIFYDLKMQKKNYSVLAWIAPHLALCLVVNRQNSFNTNDGEKHKHDENWLTK